MAVPNSSVRGADNPTKLDAAAGAAYFSIGLDCAGRLAKACGLGGLLSPHSIESNALLKKVSNES